MANHSEAHAPHPFEQAVLDVLSASGWRRVTDLAHVQGGRSATFEHEGESLFLLISPRVRSASGVNDVTAGAQVIAGALDLGVYARIIFATAAEVPTDFGPALARVGVELWTPTDLARLRHVSRAPDPARLPALLRVRRLEVTGFRGFHALDLPLPGTGPLVIAGPNGVGKSSVLAAIGLCLSWLPALVADPAAAGARPRSSDVNHGADGCAARLSVSTSEPDGPARDTGDGAGLDVAWRVVADGGDAAEIDEIRLRAQAYGEALHRDRDACLPMVMHYPVHRALVDMPEWHDEDTPWEDQLDAWRGAFDWDLHRGFHAFFRWFRAREDLENQRRLEAPGHRDAGLEAVRRAVGQLMGGYTGLQVDREAQTLTLSKQVHGGSPVHLQVEQLSDGEKTLLALTGDVARRLSLLNPGLPDPLLGGGVVLIDEIELHLHPGWQRTVVGRLQDVFPNLQLILTTHSPVVLSHVPTDNIVLLAARDGLLVAERPLGGFGWDSNRILDVLMDVPERPSQYKERLAAVGRLLDDERLDEATRLLAALTNELGRYDGEVMRLQAILDFLED